MKKIFYCSSNRSFVQCEAPLYCSVKCKEYKAKLITGVAERELKCEGQTIRTLTGFLDGKLVLVSK